MIPFDRSHRTNFMVTFLFLAGLLIFGSLGYILIEGWSLADSFTMTVQTVTTLGMREVRPLSPAGLMYTNFLVIVGVIGMMYALGVVAEVFVQGYFEEALGRRKDKKMLEKLDSHTIICGGGRTGKVIAEELAARREPFILIEFDPAVARQLQDQKIPTLVGDATQDEVLVEAGIERAKGLITSMGTDKENVFISLSARQLNSGLTIVAKSSDDNTTGKLKRAGADIVINPFETGGTRLALSLIKPTAIEFMEHLMQGHAADQVVVDEILLGANHPWTGKTLRELPSRQESMVNILGIKAPAGSIDLFPQVDHRLDQGSVLIVMGERDRLRSLKGA